MFVTCGKVSFCEKCFINYEITLNDYKMPLLLVVCANLENISTTALSQSFGEQICELMREGGQSQVLSVD